MSGEYGTCRVCSGELEPVWRIKPQFKRVGRARVETGKQKKVVDYLVCPICGNKQKSDGQFDSNWY